MSSAECQVFQYPVLLCSNNYVVGDDVAWYCDDQCCRMKGCKVLTKDDELHLKYPHTEAMHQSKGQKPKQSPVVKEFTGLNDDNDDEMFGLFE